MGLPVEDLPNLKSPFVISSLQILQRSIETGYPREIFPAKESRKSKIGHFAFQDFVKNF
jgi:hypothetical protein